MCRRPAPEALVFGDHLIDAALGWGRVGGIEEQVEQHLLDFVVVGKYRRRSGARTGSTLMPLKRLL